MDEVLRTSIRKHRSKRRPKRRFKGNQFVVPNKTVVKEVANTKHSDRSSQQLSK